MLDELDAAIKEFDASLQDTDDGKLSHVAARAEMKELGDEIMRLVGMLDGFNRNRFHRNPELIVAWQSAKHVVTGPQPKDPRVDHARADDAGATGSRKAGGIAYSLRYRTCSTKYSP